MEAERTITKKRPEALPFFHEFVGLLMLRADPDEDLITHVSQRIVLADANDVPIVASAMRAQADYLATYDRKHLLSMGEQIHAEFGILEATPQDLLAPST